MYRGGRDVEPSGHNSNGHQGGRHWVHARPLAVRWHIGSKRFGINRMGLRPMDTAACIVTGS